MAGLIILPEHAPNWVPLHTCLVGTCRYRNLGLSRRLYDALRIASFACLIVGTISVIYAMSVSLRRPARAA